MSSQLQTLRLNPRIAILLGMVLLFVIALAAVVAIAIPGYVGSSPDHPATICLPNWNGEMPQVTSYGITYHDRQGQIAGVSTALPRYYRFSDCIR